MRTIRITLDEITRKKLDIGFVGEKDHVQVSIACGAVFAKHPDAEVSMVADPPVGDMYPIVTTVEDACVIWSVSDSDVGRAGDGSFQLTFTDEGEIFKTAIGSYSVKPSLQATGEPPEPIEDWIQRANEALNHLDDEVTEAAAEWLEENISNPDSPPLDRSLSSSSAAAPADVVGGILNHNKAEMDGFIINESSSFYSPVSFRSGDFVVVDVESISGTYSVFTEGYTSTVYKTISIPGKYIITPTNNGRLRFYRNLEGTISGKIYIGSRLYNVESNSILNDLRTNGIADKTAALDSTLYTQTEIASWKSEGYRMNGTDGAYHTDANYDTRFFTVSAGDMLKITSYDMFQFQSSSGASTTADKRTGYTYGSGVYFLTVPQGATSLAMCYPKSGNTPTVSKINTNILAEATDSISGLYEKLKYYKKTYLVHASTEHSPLNDQIQINIDAGDKFQIVFSSSAALSQSSTINIKAYYSDDTNEYIAIGQGVPSEIELIASKNIVTLGFWSGGSFSSSDVNITAEVYIAGTALDNDLNQLPEINELQIKTVTAFNSLTTNNGSYSFNQNATIKNYRDYATSSTYAYNSQPIKIRNKNGNLIYNNLHYTATSNMDVTAFWAFGKSGKYLRTVTITQYRARQTNFLADEYYVILNQFTSLPDYEWRVSNVEIEWLNNQNKNEYTVGTGGDFATFTAMLNALQNDDSEKTVYVLPGEYDIFAEMGGAEYMEEISETASELNWRDVCPVVPPNTKIIGQGNVVLKWIATAAEMIDHATAFLFSPLNVSGSCYIENINVIAQNCRYAIHDETSGQAAFNGAKHHFKNCSFTMLSGTYGGPAYGAGHNKLMEFIYDNCIFDSRSDKGIWSTHDWTAQVNESSSFVFNNCLFLSTKTDPYVNLSSSDTYGRKDKVLFNNCYLPKINYTTGGSQAKQGYEVTLIGCSPVEITYSTNVTDRYETKQHNPIPQST